MWLVDLFAHFLLVPLDQDIPRFRFSIMIVSLEFRDLVVHHRTHGRAGDMVGQGGFQHSCSVVRYQSWRTLGQNLLSSCRNQGLLLDDWRANGFQWIAVEEVFLPRKGLQ